MWFFAEQIQQVLELRFFGFTIPIEISLHINTCDVFRCGEKGAKVDGV